MVIEGCRIEDKGKPESKYYKYYKSQTKSKFCQILYFLLLTFFFNVTLKQHYIVLRYRIPLSDGDNIIERKFFLGFIRLHILHHARAEPFFGLWMISELQKHGYNISPGTLYPILHNLESDGLLSSSKKNINGKIRKYYSITKIGENFLDEGTKKAKELIEELME